jgi:hypothetical protein
MDWLTFLSNFLTFIASVIDSLVWPTVAFYVLYHLRPQLRDLAARLIKLAFPGGEVVFSAKLEEARERLEEIERSK